MVQPTTSKLRKRKARNTSGPLTKYTNARCGRSLWSKNGRSTFPQVRPLKRPFTGTLPSIFEGIFFRLDNILGYLSILVWPQGRAEQVDPLQHIAELTLIN